MNPGMVAPVVGGACAVPRERNKTLLKLMSNLGWKSTCAECALYAVVFVKPLADMLWMAPWLDVVLTVAALIALVLLVAEQWVRFGIPDVVALLLVALVIRSWSEDTSAFSTMVKMGSAFVLYFMGRLSVPYYSNALKAIRISALICVVVCMIMYVLGIGFKTWGFSRTFCGPYYFKTDLAFAMTFAAALLLYWKDGPKWRLLAVVSCFFLVFESNARAYYFASVVVLALYFAWRYSVRIGFGTIAGVALSIVLVLELLNVATSVGLLGNGFIGFQFSSLADLFSGANTQGRNEIWLILLGMIKASPLTSKLFGIDLASDLIMVNGSEYGSHSLYVGTLFNLGIVGLLLLFLFVLYIFRSVTVTQARNQGDETPYLVLTLVLIFLISGISVHVLQYSANTWIPMLMFGVVVSMARENVPDVRASCPNGGDHA